MTAELLQENHFHAVQEAIKRVAQRISDFSGLSSDGAELAQTSLGGGTPVLAVTALVTGTRYPTERSAQKIYWDFTAHLARDAEEVRAQGADKGLFRSEELRSRAPRFPRRVPSAPTTLGRRWRRSSGTAG